MSNKVKLINFYEKMPKKFINKSRNPNKAIHGLELPFRLCICGGSGSMKSNTILNIIHQMNGTFEKIIICTKNANEPLYNYLKSKMKDLDIYEGIENLPPLDDFDEREQSLVIFDDLVLEKNQKYIEEYFIRCRKLSVSCIYCSQSWFKIPKIIRSNLNYIILKKISCGRDLALILSEYSLGVDKSMLQEIYKFALGGDKTNFLLIDLEAPEEKKFRRNFDVLNIS